MILSVLPRSRLSTTLISSSHELTCLYLVVATVLLICPFSSFVLIQSRVLLLLSASHPLPPFQTHRLILSSFIDLSSSSSSLIAVSIALSRLFSYTYSPSPTPLLLVLYFLTHSCSEENPARRPAQGSVQPAFQPRGVCPASVPAQRRETT